MTPPATTEAAVLVETGLPLRLLELALPGLGAGQVLVEIAYSGICRSQLNEARGHRGRDPYLPHTLGHEGSGTVLAVGEAVAKVAPGDAVVLTWIKGAGAEVPSTVYESEIGPVNSGAISTFLRHAVVSENRLVPLPAGLPLREAALLGCAMPTGGGIVRHTADVKPGDAVAIIGVGGVGMAALIAAALRGAAPLIAVDIRREKLETAGRLGASHLVHAPGEDVVARIRDITGGGADLAIEATGRPQAMEAAFASVRPGGGLCVLAGNAAVGERIGLDPFDLIRGRRIVGSWGGDTRPDVDIPAYAEEAISGSLPLAALMGETVALSQINEAMDALEHGEVLRTIVDLSLG